VVCENLVKYYSKKKDFNYIILRLCPIIGPGITHGIVYDLAQMKPPIKLRGCPPGSNRTYVHVDDLINLLGEVIKLNSNEIINVSNFDYINNEELAWLIHSGDISWDMKDGHANDLCMNNDKMSKFIQLKYRTSKSVICAHL
jgi:nucleoside-diphosphate-sugar epimerase